MNIELAALMWSDLKSLDVDYFVETGHSRRAAKRTVIPYNPLVAEIAGRMLDGTWDGKVSTPTTESK